MQRPALNIIAVLVILLVAVVGLSFLFPAWGERGPSMRTGCISNLKQLGTASQIYLADYDDKFAPRTWYDPLMPYVKSKDLFQCPQLWKDKVTMWGYAMNVDIMGADFGKIADPSKQPQIFEVDALAQDVVANLAARALTRHVTGSNVARCDSSVKFIKAADTVVSWPVAK